jgi:hypothetical protein
VSKSPGGGVEPWPGSPGGLAGDGIYVEDPDAGAQCRGTPLPGRLGMVRPGAATPYGGASPGHRRGVGRIAEPSRSGSRSVQRQRSLPSEGSEKVNVLVADNPWCNSNEELGTVREAVEGIEQLVEYTKVGSPPCNRIRNLGYAGGAFLEGNRSDSVSFIAVNRKCW